MSERIFLCAEPGNPYHTPFTLNLDQLRIQQSEWSFFSFHVSQGSLFWKRECIGCCSTLPVYIIWPALNTVLRQMKAAEMLVVKIYDFQSKALKNETFSLHFVLYINMVLNMLCLLKTVAAYTLQTDIFCFCREGQCFQVALAGLRSRQSISIGLTPAFD